MDAITSLAGLLSSTKLGLDALGAASTLLDRARTRHSADVSLLRIALLQVDHNLVVLNALRTTKLNRADAEAVLSGISALRIDALVELLLQADVPMDVLPLPANVSEAKFRRSLEANAVRDQTLVLLALARFIVSRVGGLATLERVDARARRNMALGVRVRNLKRAHIDLRKLLSTQEATAPLTKTAHASAPAEDIEAEED